MNNFDYNYIRLMQYVLHQGEEKTNRTGINTKSITGFTLKHKMSDGFPALLSKRLPFKTSMIELESFIKGNTDKQWLKDRGCNIWNQWCRPDIIPDGLSDKERKTFQLENNDLGPIYGAQWNKENTLGISQIDYVLEQLKNNQYDRRMVVSAWNHMDRDKMALEPCHVIWQVIVTNNRLDLIFYMRSVDIFLGMPFDIALYGVILHLLAKEFDLTPGTLIGMFGDTHIYMHHIDAVKTQISRLDKIKNLTLPKLKVCDSFKTFKDFNSEDVLLKDYHYMASIKAEVAI